MHLESVLVVEEFIVVVVVALLFAVAGNLHRTFIFNQFLQIFSREMSPLQHFCKKMQNGWTI
jgi:hypothetical protein